MKKLIISYLTASSIAFSPLLRAQQPADESPNPTVREYPTPELPSQESVPQEDSPSPHPDQDSSTPEPPDQEMTTPESLPSEEEYEGTPVGHAANEGSNAAKRKRIQNIVLATVAVAVAVTALLLIASNDGHEKD